METSSTGSVNSVQILDYNNIASIRRVPNKIASTIAVPQETSTYNVPNDAHHTTQTPSPKKKEPDPFELSLFLPPAQSTAGTAVSPETEIRTIMLEPPDEYNISYAIFSSDEDLSSDNSDQISVRKAAKPKFNAKTSAASSLKEVKIKPANQDLSKSGK